MGDHRTAEALRAGRLPVVRRLAVGLVLFLCVLLGGTAAFTLTQDVALAEAAYFTLITVFAVGFAEVFPLDGVGRVITSAVIVLGVGSFTFLTITLLEFLVEGHLLDLVGRRRMQRELAAIDGHMIICGFGRVGRQCADDLLAAGRRAVVVDTDPERAALAIDKDLLHVVGDASDESVLDQAGLVRATGLAAVTDDDAENVLIALTAKLARPDLFVVVRVKDARNATKAQQAGADRVIAPSEIGGRRIAALLTKPEVVDFLDVVTHANDVDLVLEELHVTDGSSLVGATLATAQLRDRFGVNVVAVRRAGGDRATTRPDPGIAFVIGDVLVVIGAQADLDRLHGELG